MELCLLSNGAAAVVLGVTGESQDFEAGVLNRGCVVSVENGIAA